MEADGAGAPRPTKPKLSGLANTLATVDVVRIVDENPTNLNDYGLSNARIAVAFKAEGDKDYRRLLLGEKTPTGSDLFARRNDEKKVFLIPAFQEATLNKSRRSICATRTS